MLSVKTIYLLFLTQIRPGLSSNRQKAVDNLNSGYGLVLSDVLMNATCRFLLEGMLFLKPKIMEKIKINQNFKKYHQPIDNVNEEKKTLEISKQDQRF